MEPLREAIKSPRQNLIVRMTADTITYVCGARMRSVEVLDTVPEPVECLPEYMIFLTVRASSSLGT